MEEKIKINKKTKSAIKKEESSEKSGEKIVNAGENEKKEEAKTEEIQKNEDKEKTAKESKNKKENQKPKKYEAVVNGRSLPISTKYSRDICKFIKHRDIESSIKDLEQVIICKRAIPMKGEYAHKKGKGMMAGKYPKKAAEHFIKLLKSLSANASVNGINNPVIVEAFANIAPRPSAKFGRWHKKRTHIKITAREKTQDSYFKNPEKEKKGDKT